MIIFAVESSCDETAVALYTDQNTDNRVLAHQLFSQIEIHKQYKGVVPELAARNHIQRLVSLSDKCFKDAGISKQDIDAVAYTMGPGLIPCLLAGASYARSLAFALGVKALAVHHLEGHILSPLLNKDKKSKPFFPYIALLASGGHTQLYLVKDYGKYELCGQSVDDAVGEAFDKTALLLGLAYPGGAELEKLAKQGNPNTYLLTMPMAHSGDYNFSFSGIKTQARYLVERLRKSHSVQTLKEEKSGIKGIKDKTEEEGTEEASRISQRIRANIATSFQHTIATGLLDKTFSLATKYAVRQVALVGGVSANQYLRNMAEERARELHIKLYFAEPQYCLDNAAMIALTAEYRFKQGQKNGLTIRSRPRCAIPPAPLIA